MKRILYLPILLLLLCTSCRTWPGISSEEVRKTHRKEFKSILAKDRKMILDATPIGLTEDKVRQNMKDIFNLKLHEQGHHNKHGYQRWKPPMGAYSLACTLVKTHWRNVLAQWYFDDEKILLDVELKVLYRSD